jgi:hypothetical protein
MKECMCGHVQDEHGGDEKYPGSTACTVSGCDCIAYEECREDDGDGEKIQSGSAPMTPDDAVVEAVARELYHLEMRFRMTPTPWERLELEEKSVYLQDADEVISAYRKAMRERGMVEVDGRIIARLGDMMLAHFQSPEDQRDIQTMLSAVEGE